MTKVNSLTNKLSAAISVAGDAKLPPRPQSLTKRMLAEQLVAQHDLSQLDAMAVIDSLLCNISVQLALGGRVELRGFGVFYVRSRRARMALNPKTLERVAVPAGTRVAFLPSKLGAHGKRRTRYAKAAL